MQPSQTPPRPENTSSSPTPKHRGFAIASLILGIAAILFGFFIIGALFGILAIIFGAIAFADNRNVSLAGIITGSVGIVIAIAMVFIAIYFAATIIGMIASQAGDDLQASQRDTQRKNDIGVLTSDITYSMAENRGQLPDNEFVDGMTYKLEIITGSIGKTLGNDTIQPTTDTAVYTMGEDCDGVESARNFSLTILLENNETYCQGS